MWGLDALGVQYNEATGTVGLPLWAAAAAGVLLLFFFILALVRTGAAGTLMFLALVGFGGWAVWTWTDYARASERRAVEARLQVLETAAQAANAPLGCLAASGNEALETACERVLYASAETVANATAYAARQIALLSDGIRLAAKDAAFARTFDPLRKTLEQDRYGFVAQALVSRNGCNAEKCDAFGWFKDTTRISANMRDNLFAAHVTRASATWGERVAAAPPAPPAPTATMTPQPAPSGTPLPAGYNLPSSASIPPVSIMQSEPAGPAAAPAPPRTATQQPARRTSPRRPERQSEARPAPPPGTGGPNGPVPLQPRPQ